MIVKYFYWMNSMENLLLIITKFLPWLQEVFMVKFKVMQPVL